MNRKLIHVVAAVIRNESGQILIAKRSADQHQGGLWEFPGGKVEPGESVDLALGRELDEELGIQVRTSRPLIKVPYHYEDKSVLLDVYEVTHFDGDAWGKEGQPVEWVASCELDNYQFPAANKPILNACLLPESWFITPVPLSGDADYSAQIDHAIDMGAEAVMLRAHHLGDRVFQTTAEQLHKQCMQKGILFALNRDCDLANRLAADALHLTSRQLERLNDRTEYKGRWLSASCHSRKEVAMAVRKGLDFVTLSPVCKTSSHPDAKELGWEEFRAIADDFPIPVYALGGLSNADIDMAMRHGAQGIAAISAWLEE